MDQNEVKETETETPPKKTINWGQLIFCTAWFCAAGYILVSYLMGTLNAYYVPRIISWLYDLVGIMAASSIQLLIMAIGIYTSFPKRKTEEGRSK